MMMMMMMMMMIPDGDADKRPPELPLSSLRMEPIDETDPTDLLSSSSSLLLLPLVLVLPLVLLLVL